MVRTGQAGSGGVKGGQVLQKMELKYKGMGLMGVLMLKGNGKVVNEYQQDYEEMTWKDKVVDLTKESKVDQLGVKY